MFNVGDVISYLEMCQEEGVNLQRGMNYRLRGNYSVILMSRRQGAPYNDRIENEGSVLIYEGHDVARTKGVDDPKNIDQPSKTESGKLTQNGLFFDAAMKYKSKGVEPELVRVYEKLYPGIWVFNGVFNLVDAWQEEDDKRFVFKFKLELSEKKPLRGASSFRSIEHTRIIPTAVKQEVWKRDKGRCVICGSRENLHFDHIIPFSKGGSSLVAENIQLLCAKHNIAKKDKIE